MTEESIPEAWIGQRVSLRYGEESRVFCNLEAINDRGVIVEESGKNGEPITAFYPWSSVIAIKVGETERPRGEKLQGSHRGY